MKHIKLFETYFKDLSICDYSIFTKECRVKAVGFLCKEEPFEKGDVDPEIIKKLEKYKPQMLAMGYHHCEFCDDKNAKGCSEILVVNKQGQVYEAPILIIHYIKDHNYLPPQEFLDAIENGYFYGDPKFNEYAKGTLEIVMKRLRGYREKREKK